MLSRSMLWVIANRGMNGSDNERPLTRDPRMKSGCQDSCILRIVFYPAIRVRSFYRSPKRRFIYRIKIFKSTYVAVVINV
jgi:hypothetical protein